MSSSSGLTRPSYAALGLVCVCVGLGCEEKRGPAPAPTPSGTTTSSPAASGGAANAAFAMAPASTALPAFDPAQLNLFAPIPESVETPLMDDATKLGQMLFFDKRLSRGQDMACVSCHDFAKAGQDGEAAATGTKKQGATRNTPSVLNAGGAFAQGWDARATTIDELVVPHILDPAIMGMPDEKRVTETIATIPAYVAAFKKAFPEESPAVSADTVARALGTYTKKLFARSRWDRYLAGDKAALNDAELGGVATFVEAGCTSCHQGKYVGGTQAAKLGIAKPWPGPAGEEPGRFAVSKQEADRGMWKVPSLRNVARTGPYLHDGSVASLEEMTRLMARHQAGRELSEPQIKAIVTWLGTLDGEAPKVLTTKPQLPPSGPKTPKAD